jgi:hypothetical protein
MVPGPSTIFVSHAYGDADALAACLCRRMPGGAKPVVFPAITVTPDEAVSSALIDAIRSASALVYLDTARSRQSFWVGFERNIAARLGKPVYAFRPRRPLFAVTRDRRPAQDPLVSVLFNLCIADDAAAIQEIRGLVWDRYGFEIRGDQWKHLDNDARQMLDSIDGLRRKFDAGGVALLFVSTASVCASHHDYADPYTMRRAHKDMETPDGHAAEKFAALDAERTLVIWLDRPDRARIEPVLANLGHDWTPYARIVRASLDDRHRLMARQPNGAFDLNQLDTMLARCFWSARMSDPALAARWRDAVTSSAPAR